MNTILSTPMTRPRAQPSGERRARAARAPQRWPAGPGDDKLTALPGRGMFDARLARLLAAARRAGGQLAVLFIGLDTFSLINDGLGHSTGDRVLREAARRLARCVRAGDVLARVGGDEFAVVLDGLDGPLAAEAVAARVLAALSQSQEVAAINLALSASIGVSRFPADGASACQLLRNADAAQRCAKRTGRNRWQYYQEQHNAGALAQLRFAAALRQALERDQFVLHYQAQADLASGEVVGVEALLRWERPGHGLVGPAEFIRAAEENGMIGPIGEWVLRSACAQQVCWARAGFPALRVAVNLSARQFRQPDLAQRIIGILADSGCAPACLELELTESALLDDPAAAAASLRELTALGVGLSIDDFGTGYASLSYLKAFPLRALKVDRSFVRNLASDSGDGAIVSAVIALAHELGLLVVAEGVETAAQLAALCERACDQMQGYLLSRPLPAAQIAALLGPRRDGG
jgi:diguanylate cyclase (GGDEF)-like protein